jgi:glycine oxidase
MTDFIIVGRGLAATTLMHVFYRSGITFKVVSKDNLSKCSRIAAGIWNPVVFKRMTKSWLADNLVSTLNLFYSECESTLNKKLITHRPIIKPFTEDQEKKLWKEKAASFLENFIDPGIYDLPDESLKHLKINNGYGVVKGCGNLDVAAYLDASETFFKDHVVDEVFDHKELQIKEEVLYKNIKAKSVIFCEGYLVKNNPFFWWIPLKPAKGEILTVRAQDLELKDSIFNRDGFLMDISDKIFRVGATYEWRDLSEESTQEGLNELHNKLERMINCPYTILKHEAGIRPSSSDRRPIIGAHPQHKRLFVFNGLGTKGVMLAPYFAKNFVNFYLQKEAIHKEVNVSRFYHLYGEKK